MLGTDDLFRPVYPTFNSVTGPAPCFVIGSTSDFVIGPISSSIAGLALNSVTSYAPGIVVNRISLVVIVPTKSNYFYGKQVTAKDLIISKLYMNGTICIQKISFCETSKI